MAPFILLILQLIILIEIITHLVVGPPGMKSP